MTEPNAGIYAKLPLMNDKIDKNTKLAKLQVPNVLFKKNKLSFKN